jgi:hypothetical protein
MENTKKENRELTRNLILSSIIWAVVMLGCSFNAGGSKKEIIYIILFGFFIELLRMSVLNKSLKKDRKREVN